MFFCGVSLLDTGTTFTNIANDSVNSLINYPATGGLSGNVLAPGANVSLCEGTSHSPVFTFDSGYAATNEVITTSTAAGSGLSVVMAVQLFLTDTVTYDAVGGIVTLS